MTTTDWIIDIVLVLLVLRQIREERMTPRFFLIPAGLVAFTAHKYLHGIPTSGNDLWLVAAAALLGTSLGVLGGIWTRVRLVAGQPMVRAGWKAATLWVGNMTARLLFIIWITHSGGPTIARWGFHHSLTVNVWPSALVLLALSEVVGRMVTIAVRGGWLVTKHQPATPAQRSYRLAHTELRSLDDTELRSLDDVELRSLDDVELRSLDDVELRSLDDTELDRVA